MLAHPIASHFGRSTRVEALFYIAIFQWPVSLPILVYPVPFLPLVGFGQWSHHPRRTPEYITCIAVQLPLKTLKSVVYYSLNMLIPALTTSLYQAPTNDSLWTISKYEVSIFFYYAHHSTASQPGHYPAVEKSILIR